MDDHSYNMQFLVKNDVKKDKKFFENFFLNDPDE